MEGGNEQRFAIKFCFKAGLSATETLVLVQMAYWNEALNQSNFLGGILDFETEKMTREVAVQNRLELR
jgi:predicted small integral membrane protein